MIKHIPYRKPRDSFPREGIYLRVWQDYIERNGHSFDKIMREKVVSNMKQSDARVAASFIVFMATNAGQDFTATYYRDREAAKDLNYSIIMTWAYLNQRTSWYCGGLRLIEAMLATEDCRDSRGDVDWRKVRDITMREIDVVEAMVHWWATPDAEVFREKAEMLYQAEVLSLKYSG